MSDSQHKTRLALIQAAAKLLECHGLPAVTLRAVGQAVGVSRTTPYRHFENKEDLLKAVAVEYFEQLEQWLAEIVKNAATPYMRLEGLLLGFLQFMIDHPQRYELMMSHNLQNHEDGAILAASQKIFTIFIEVVKEAQIANIIDQGDPIQIAALLFSSCHGVADLSLAGHIKRSKGLEPASLMRLLIQNLSIE